MTTPFPTLDTDLADPPDEPAAAPKRICIATADVPGPARNGGIGTAFHHAARLLAEWGHEVVIAYVNRKAADTSLMAEIRARYAGLGVTFEPVAPRRHTAATPLTKVSAPTWALLDWLRAHDRPFDLVHVSECRGLGYGPLLAKSLGLAFGSTHFVVKGSSPTLWLMEGNAQLLSEGRDLGWVFMERRSIELADTVVCGSAHLLEWMRDAGYALPARAFVWPNVFPAPDTGPAAAAARAARDGAPLDEVVFFGRLEPRKGTVLFVDAIDRLVRQGRAPARVTFLGMPVAFFDALQCIRDAARDWPIEVGIHTELGTEEAVAYLSRPGRLAVIPSLLENASIAVTECLHAGIPFVAAATGGTPELIDPADHGRVLVPADHVALGDRIAALAAAPLRPARPCREFAATLDVWARWHAQTVPFAASSDRFAARARGAAAAKPPVVTVCLVHHERPAPVRMAADSVLAQDYPALDAVLVDAGSASAAARAAVDAIEADFAPRGWRVVRQENRYAGAARNAAAAAAHGEWLLFLGDDDVLFPDAVSRLVRSARFAEADCVPAAGVPFAGDGDPRDATALRGPPVRYLGAAPALSRIENVAGGACALVRRDAFEAVGGFAVRGGVTVEAPAFFSKLIREDRRIEPSPDPVCCHRTQPASAADLLRDRYRDEVARAQALAPHVEGLPAEERAFASYVAGADAAQANPVEDRPPRVGSVMALARRAAAFGIGRLEVSVLVDPDWFDWAWRQYGRAVVELRRNGRTVAQATAPDPETEVRIAAGSGLSAAGATFSLHDAGDGDVLATLTAPSLRRARRVIGGVESRKWRKLRGWVLDPAEPERRRWVAVRVEGRLRAVVRAGEPRGDIARWRRTGGAHGFRWWIPSTLAVPDGARIDVTDAGTGRALRGSPVRVEGERLIADDGSAPANGSAAGVP